MNKYIETIKTIILMIFGFFLLYLLLNIPSLFNNHVIEKEIKELKFCESKNQTLEKYYANGFAEDFILCKHKNKVTSYDWSEYKRYKHEITLK